MASSIRGDDPDGSASSGPAPRWRTIEPGTLLGRYEIGEELGLGGMATVFRARDRELRRDVAVKVLFPQLARRREVVARFQREARAAAALEHPNILRIYDVGGPTPAASDGAPLDPPYMVMELVRGGSLRELGENHGVLLGELVAAIGIVIARALGAAHRAGIVHRDVKPGNVLCAGGADEGRRLALADFGVAHIEGDDASLVTRTGALLGTPAFMSPEQAQGASVDARSDLYSLGATLYQLATGGPPYAGSTARVVAAIARGELVEPERRNPALGAALSRIILKLMAVEPEDRYPSAESVEAALAEVVAEGGLGKPEDEIAAYLAAPDAWAGERRVIVREAVFAAATRAAEAGHTARALALADRVLALTPEHAGAAALAARVGRRRQVRRGRRVVAFALMGAAAGMGMVVWMQRAEDAAITADAGAGAGAEQGLEVPPAPGAGSIPSRGVGSASAASLLGVTPAEREGHRSVVAAASDASEVPAAGRASGAAPRVGSGVAAPGSAAAATSHRRASTPLAVIDAGVAVDAVRAAPTDAGPALAPTAPVAVAAVADAVIHLDLRPWCDVEIDGAPQGRADKTRAVRLAPGRHELRCSQGPGLAEWRETVTLAAGEARTIRGDVLTAVTVTIAVSAGDAVRLAGAAHKNGASARIRPGRYRVEVLSGGKATRTAWVTIPRGEACAIKDRPELDCYRE